MFLLHQHLYILGRLNEDCLSGYFTASASCVDFVTVIIMAPTNVILYVGQLLLKIWGITKCFCLSSVSFFMLTAPFHAVETVSINIQH